MKDIKKDSVTLISEKYFNCVLCNEKCPGYGEYCKKHCPSDETCINRIKNAIYKEADCLDEETLNEINEAVEYFYLEPMGKTNIYDAYYFSGAHDQGKIIKKVLENKQKSKTNRKTNMQMMKEIRPILDNPKEPKNASDIPDGWDVVKEIYKQAGKSLNKGKNNDKELSKEYINGNINSLFNLLRIIESKLLSAGMEVK